MSTLIKKVSATEDVAHNESIEPFYTDVRKSINDRFHAILGIHRDIFKTKKKLADLVLDLGLEVVEKELKKIKK